jgi:3D-(3,5/4)-trihydroxycyclohexane-1,2-dione acylhydrolase (decyclizing)
VVSKSSVFKSAHNEPTVRLTVAQAVVRFLANQYVERDGERKKFFAGCFGIFGHGNVAGMGQALLQAEVEAEQAGTEPDLRYVLGRNEQAMVHTAAAYARQKDRLQAWAVTASIGPGSTNMLTGAALATINRLPVLLLPSDTFATRVSAPVLQDLEQPHDNEMTVNDAFKPLSRFFDRVWRPEQLPSALLGAMDSLFVERTWHVARPLPERSVTAQAAEIIASAQRPLVVAGGGVIYSGANDALTAFVERTGIPVSETQAGKGSLPYDHPQSVGAVGSTGSTAANALAAEADVVIGIGTRYSDFTSASRTAFNNPDVRFVNINVASFDAVKQGGLSVVADAREAIEALTEALADYSVSDDYRTRTIELATQWDDTVTAAYRVEDDGSSLNQSQVIGLANTLSDPRDVVVCAAGSMPGDLHKLWRTRDRKGYHVEYGYSCMGYEVAGGIGVRMASPDRDVFVMVGDGSYLMMATELVTAVQEGVKVILVLVQNHGFASIGSLSESLGSQRFGTSYRYRDDSGRLAGDKFADAVKVAKAGEHTTVIHVETDPLIYAPDSESWWDVPVSQTSELDSTAQAYETYAEWKKVQRPYTKPYDAKD